MLHALLALTLVSGLDADLAFCAGAEKKAEGKIVLKATTDASGNKGIRACAYVTATTAETYAVLIDYKSFPKWMDKVENIEVGWVDEKTALVDYSLDTMAGDFKYQLKRMHQPGKHVEWHRVKGDFKTITGTYDFIPIAGDPGSYFIIETYVDAGKAIPGFIENYFREKGARRLVEDIRGETTRRYKK